MCQTTNEPTIKTAEQDIIVYKRCHNPTKSSCRSIVMDFTYLAGHSNREMNLNPQSYGEKVYVTEKGYHSFNEPSLRNGANAIFKIPQGSHYIDGWDNDNRSYVSRVSSFIVYVRPLKETRWEKFLVKMGWRKPLMSNR